MIKTLFTLTLLPISLLHRGRQKIKNSLQGNLIILTGKPYYMTHSRYLDHNESLSEHGMARKEKNACSFDYLVEMFGQPDGTILPGKSQVSLDIQVDVSITA